jgi:sodium transport system ATP-binding protein
MVEVEGLSKVFRDPKTRSDVRAVDGVSFCAHPGEVFGLLGPNGAGKTTLVRMLATILAPTSGSATIAGYDLQRDPAQVRARIGYLTGVAALYERMTPREMLMYFGDLYGLTAERKRTRIASLTATLEMGEFIDRRCDKLSTGQRQRVSIARSVLHDPPVLFFDEPTSGLDVMAARTVTRFIRQCSSEGRTVIFSTHIMSEVESLCDRIAVIFHGRVAANGSLRELQSQIGAGPDASFESVFLRLVGETVETEENGHARLANHLS